MRSHKDIKNLVRKERLLSKIENKEKPIEKIQKQESIKSTTKTSKKM
jgi:hypothetical protein